MNFILFGNLTYGEIAIQKFVDLANTYPDHNFRIVLSGREVDYTSQGEPLFESNSDNSMDLEMYTNSVTNRFSFPVEIEVDVNRSRFIGSIPEDTIGFCVGFNQMFSTRLLERVLFIINFHPSLLPCYYGPLPVYRCLKRGEQRTGYTAHIMTKKIEPLKIIFQDVVDIDPLMTEEELENRIGQKASEYVEDMILRFLNGKDMRYQVLDAKKVYKYPDYHFSIPVVSESYNRKN